MTDSEFLTRPIVAETIPPGGDPNTFGERCALRHQHTPQPRYLERHHVIPRAWQHFFVPPEHDISPPAHPPDRNGVWYPVTELLCRTGHGNVHYWIERAMKAYVSVPTGPDHSERAMRAARDGQLHISEHETRLALDALILFDDYGGNVFHLIDHGLWGGLYGGNDSDT
jgi:hypothetical protein